MDRIFLCISGAIPLALYFCHGRLPEIGAGGTEECSPTPEDSPGVSFGEDKGADVEGQQENEEALIEGDGAVEGEEEIDIPFIPVTLSFSDICYDVKASTGKDTIRLLNNVYGIFESGHICALMGSSRAGE